MDKERELFWNLEQKLPGQVVNAVAESMKSLLTDAADIGTNGIDENYSRILFVYQDVDDTYAEATVTISFTHTSDYDCNKGYRVRLMGKCSDGTDSYDSEWDEVPAGYRGKGEIKDLVDLIENQSLTDWTYNVIEMFFEYLRNNLKERKGVVA